MWVRSKANQVYGLALSLAEGLQAKGKIMALLTERNTSRALRIVVSLLQQQNFLPQLWDPAQFKDPRRWRPREVVLLLHYLVGSRLHSPRPRELHPLRLQTAEPRLPPVED